MWRSRMDATLHTVRHRRPQSLSLNWLVLVLALVVLVALKSCEGSTHPQDLEALEQIKASVLSSSIPSFSCVGSWNFSADPCDTISSAQLFVCGVGCDSGVNGKDRRVTTLTLDSPGYEGSLSPYVGNLSALRILDFSSNSFTGSMPETLGLLKNLVTLDLSGNEFSGSMPASVGQLENLQHFIVSNNRLGGYLPDTMSKLTKLTHLSVFSNKLSGRIPSLNQLTKLSSFDASGNNLVGSLPGDLPESLVLLSLKNNSLSGNLGGSLVAQLHRLAVLDVSRNQFTGEVDSTIFSLPNLEQANLSSNHFSGLSVVNVSAPYGQLVALDISFNEIGGSLPEFIVDMPKLSSLSLRHNQFIGGIPYEYALKATSSNGGQLARLWLDGNYLNGFIPSLFLNLTSDVLVGSFIDNCLQSCPTSLSLCQGGAQKPSTVCQQAYAKFWEDDPSLGVGNST